MWIRSSQLSFRKKRFFKSNRVPKPSLQTQVPLRSSEGGSWDLEIGSGNGEFAFRRACQFSHRNIIAIEKTRNKFKQMNQRKQLVNLWALHTNAVWWIAHYIPENFLDSIFILYPNPYPKKKQAHLRWYNRPFMKFLLDRLKTRGELEIRTNEFFYFQEGRERMQEKYPFMKQEVSCLTQGQQEPQTAFERKYLRHHPCYQLKFIKS